MTFPEASATAARSALRGCALLALLAAGCVLSPDLVPLPPMGLPADAVLHSEAAPATEVLTETEPGIAEKPPPAAGKAPVSEQSPPPVEANTTPMPGGAGDKEKGSDGSMDAGKEGEPAKKVPWYSVHEQGTIVTQVHPLFRSPYVGPNSLLPNMHGATTETATLFLAARPWSGGEIVFDPEISGGKGFSGTTGLAGFSNGEATRVGVVEPTPYIARLFLRQTWDLDGPWEKVEDAPNQVAGHRDLDNVTFTIGKLAATDIFDLNRYSHDPRTQFLNWSLMYNGAWDYPANVRGYTYGFALELNTVFWDVRYGIFAEPSTANGAPIDPHILKANGQILEFEQHWGQDFLPGKLREWVFANHAHMGKYSEALAEMPVNPDITLTRNYRFKYGFGINLEQDLTRELRLFLKAGWNDGNSESWAFTEIDRTAALGLLLNGRWWRRPNDELGLAGVINGISGPHRDYLAAGGIGFIIGDGRLNYAPEQILEAFYNCAVVKGINVSLDIQGVNHPAYNADRGPVAIGTIRLHFEH